MEHLKSGDKAYTYQNLKPSTKLNTNKQLHKSSVMELTTTRIFFNNMAKILFDRFEYYAMS